MSRTHLRTLVSAVLACAALVTGLAAVPALASDYSYWYALPQTKVYSTQSAPSTAHRASEPTTAPALRLRAAGDESEGRQIALRAIGANLEDVWLQPSDFVLRDANGDVTATISSAEVSTYKVQYVYVRTPSFGQSRKGYQPDALLPMTLANGNRLGWQPDGASPKLTLRGLVKGTTRPFYVLVHVPNGAKAGAYEGTITVTARGSDGSSVPSVQIPVRLTVYPFSIAKRTLRTAFGMSLNWIQYANSATHKWLSANPDPGPNATRIAERTNFKADQMAGWYRYMSAHRISPQTSWPAWSGGSNWAPPTDNGSMVARQDYLGDYLGTGSASTFSGRQFGFNAFRLPEVGAPSYLANPFASSSAKSLAAKYYSTAKTQLGTNASKALVYPIDEPKESKRALVEKYAAFVHSVAPGLKFFVTASGSDFGYRLIRNVDIYCNKLHFFYRDYSKWISPIRAAGKKVWTYVHASPYQSQTPNFLVDKTLVDGRAQGWFAYKMQTSGVLYFNICAWRPTMGSSSYRDPYKDPLSFRLYSQGRWVYANGDGSLVYPGYYPSLGLNVAGAPPVGSLRMEALRDGIEDYEYLKLLEAKKGRTYASSYVAKLIGKPSTVVVAGKATFPSYSKTPSSYESVRNSIASAIAH